MGTSFSALIVILLTSTAALAQSDNEILNLIARKVTLLKSLGQEIERRSLGGCPPGVNKDSCIAKLTYYIESRPDPSSKDKWKRDYYRVYVGESHITHNTRVHTFLVHKKVKNILFLDIYESEAIPLDQFLRQKKRQNTFY